MHQPQAARETKFFTDAQLQLKLQPVVFTCSFLPFHFQQQIASVTKGTTNTNYINTETNLLTRANSVYVVNGGKQLTPTIHL